MTDEYASRTAFLFAGLSASARSLKGSSITMRCARRPVIAPPRPTAKYAPPRVVENRGEARRIQLASDETEDGPAEVRRQLGRVRHIDHAPIRVPPEIEGRKRFRSDGALGVARGKGDCQPPDLAPFDRFERRDDDLVEMPGRLQVRVLSGVVDGELLPGDREQLRAELRFVDHSPSPLSSRAGEEPMTSTSTVVAAGSAAASRCWTARKAPAIRVRASRSTMKSILIVAPGPLTTPRRRPSNSMSLRSSRRAATAAEGLLSL